MDDAISDQAVLQSIHTYKRKAAKGVDHWGVPELQVLPVEVLCQYAGLLRGMYKQCAWAVQLLLNMFALLGKQSGGFRGIGLTAMPYRIAGRAESKVVTAWEQARAGFWDTAIRGCGALRAALVRAFQDEQDAVLHRHSGTILWDIAQFFDTINVANLIDKALELQFPKLQLCMSLMVHLAPRILKCDGSISKIIVVNASIVPGCGKAIAFTRALLYDVLDAAHNMVPRAVPRTYVDDISQRASSAAKHEVVEALCCGGIILADGLQHALGLRLSPKAAVVSTSPDIGRSVAAFFKDENIMVKYAAEARDLGINNTAGVKRRVGILRDRMGKGRVRVRRTGVLAASDIRARKLINTGGWSQATWGHQALGLPPSSVNTLRSAFAKGARPGDAGGCPVTTVALTLGLTSDPLVRSRLELLDAWFELWEDVVRVGRQAEVRDAWRELQKSLILGTSPGRRWQAATGPMAAVLIVLCECGWKPAAPDSWIDSQGCLWRFEPGGCLHGFRNQIVNDLAAQLWSKASHHYDGRGMEGGVDIDASKSLLSHLAKHHARNRGLLEAIMVGATWTLERKHTLMPDKCQSPLCTRCDRRVAETSFHQCWECPANDDLQDKAVTASNFLKGQARDGASVRPSLWLRGLVGVASTAPATPLPEHDALKAAGSLSELPWPPGRYYTDGSGGQHTRYRRLRRCGYGVAHFEHVDVPGDPVRGGAHAVLAHEVQTVPRAELRAATIVLENARGPIVIVTDCKLVKTGFDKGPGHRTRSHLAADWRRFWQAYHEYVGDVTVLWTKAHAVAGDLRAGRTTPMDAYGNAAADKLAEIGAMRASVTDADADAFKAEVKVARLVQARRLAILQHILKTVDKPKKDKCKVKRKVVTTLSLLKTTKHKLVQHRGRLRCCDCFRVCPAATPQKRAFLRSRCRGRKSDVEPKSAMDASLEQKRPTDDDVEARQCAEARFAYQSATVEPPPDDDVVPDDAYFDQQEDPLGLGTCLDDEDDADDDTPAPLASSARLPQSPDCEQQCSKRAGAALGDAPAAKVGKMAITQEQAAMIQSNRLMAIAKKRARQDASCLQRWERHWNELDDAVPVPVVEPMTNLREQIVDKCLDIQLDVNGNFTEHQKNVADEVLEQLESESNLDPDELLLKKRRLDEPYPASQPQPGEQDDGTAFSLTQELAALLTEDEDQGAGPGPPEAAAPPQLPPTRAAQGLDPRADELLGRLDASHTIRTFRGLAWCGRCGCYAAYVGGARPHVRDLARACQPPRPKGLDNLRRLQLHPRRWPHPLKMWPDVATEQRRTTLICEGAQR